MFNQNKQSFANAYGFPPPTPQSSGFGGLPPLQPPYHNYHSLPPTGFGGYPYPSYGLPTFQDPSTLPGYQASLFSSHPPPYSQNLYNQNPPPSPGLTRSALGGPSFNHSNPPPHPPHFSKKFGNLANVADNQTPDSQDPNSLASKRLRPPQGADPLSHGQPNKPADVNKPVFGLPGSGSTIPLPAGNSSNQSLPLPFQNQGASQGTSAHSNQLSFAGQSTLPLPSPQLPTDSPAGHSLFQTNSFPPGPSSNPFGPTPQPAPAPQPDLNQSVGPHLNHTFGGFGFTGSHPQQPSQTAHQPPASPFQNSQPRFGQPAPQSQTPGNGIFGNHHFSTNPPGPAAQNNCGWNQQQPSNGPSCRSPFSNCQTSQPQAYDSQVPQSPSINPGNSSTGGLFQSTNNLMKPQGSLFGQAAPSAPTPGDRGAKFNQLRKEMLIDTPVVREETADEEPEEPVEVEDLVKVELETRTPKILRQTSSQDVPVLLSLKPKEQDPTTVRRMGLDLVILIDVSGSMAGTKIKLLVDSLNFIVEQLTHTDRLALVAFNDQSTILSHLQPLTRDNKEKVLQVISGLVAGGGTTIRHALIDGFDILLHRTQVNDTSAIILLSDGQDNNFGSNEPGPQAVLASLMKQMDAKKMDYRLSCFGYGADHDEKLLTDLSDPCGGNFYYIRELSTIDEAFIECVGYLMSVVATDIEVGVWALGKNRLGHKYGSSWHVDGASRSVLKLGTLAGGIERNFVFDLEVAPGEETERIKALTLTLSFSLRGEYHLLVKDFEVEFTDEETGPSSQKVEQNLARLLAVEVLKQTRNHVQNGQKDVAGQLIDSFKRDFLSPSRVGQDFAGKMNQMVSKSLLEDNKQLSQNAATFGQQRPSFGQGSLFQANNVQASLFGSKKG